MIHLGGIGDIAWWQATLAIIVLVVGSARLTRILTIDDYPPSIAIRVWWQKVTHDGPWAKLVSCPWCAGPWITLIALASFAGSFLHPALGWIWWGFWGWLCLSYWVSQYVYFDQGKDD
jgi:hypothetical protein